MKRTIKTLLAATLLLLAANNATAHATEYACQPEDTLTAVRILKKYANLESIETGERIRQIAEEFIGSPYKSGTLEGEPEMPRINLREFDCTTFVESILALSLTSAENDTTFSRFTTTLTAIRYEQGESDKYTKRLHYFSKWIKQNTENGTLKEIIPQGDAAVCETKTINFMSTHADLYPALKEKSRIKEIRQIEEELSKDTICHVPKTKVAELEAGEIKDGDIIAIVTDKEGLDITHVGIAVTVNGKSHLLHASSATKKVTLDPRTISEYLMHYKSHRGIRILRATK